MSKVEILIQEIGGISLASGGYLQKVIQEIAASGGSACQLAKEALEKIAGMGDGLWTTDSQAYIQGLRTSDRL